MLSACLQGVGVLGPGLADWPAAAAVLTGEAIYRAAPTALPLPAVLPAAERRRAGRVVKLALAIAAEAVAHARADARTLASVFSSSGGDGDNCHEVCATLATPQRLLSPTRFHNSVHNAASGYWGIAYGCTEPSTTLCAFDGSFAAGLLEAFSQLMHGAPAVLLVAYDADYPAPLRTRRPIPDAFGTALLLSQPDTLPSLARLRVGFSDAAPTSMADAQLEALRRSIPAARALPLLERLARAQSGAVVVEYLDTLQLAVELDI